MSTQKDTDCARRGYRRCSVYQTSERWVRRLGEHGDDGREEELTLVKIFADPMEGERKEKEGGKGEEALHRAVTAALRAMRRRPECWIAAEKPTGGTHGVNEVCLGRNCV